ncbi:MAG: dioxygenase [Gammaproteobacteria bacterium]|nr:dioxygenase [Gammaproteobacteria bacterium]MBT8104793.1 dioxygenase [Gammaproteobacteria bacterium]NNF50087.1 dioxygenase [Woeseiaceae bacterium]NNK24807.1 dioxygenase [Woeseiaceae bacterium]
MPQLPTMFVSHGAPTLAIEDGPAHRFLIESGRRLGKPAAILVLSAHFEAPAATVLTNPAPDTIYDFGGFDEALYRVTYPAPGDPALARRVRKLLEAGGIPVREDADRGLDHGVWVPLSLMYPHADVPVVQLSIDARQGPAHHLRLGELLQPLRNEGVLILGSGGVTHNLAYALRADIGDPVPDWVTSFREWVADAIENDRRDDLVDYRLRAPDAARNHPTEEHFLPLLGAMGAALPGEARSRVHVSETYGVLAMDAYMFGATYLSPPNIAS